MFLLARLKKVVVVIMKNPFCCRADLCRQSQQIKCTVQQERNKVVLIKAYKVADDTCCKPVNSKVNTNLVTTLCGESV